MDLGHNRFQMDLQRALQRKQHVVKLQETLASSGSTHRLCPVAILRLLPCGGHGGTLWWTYEKNSPNTTSMYAISQRHSRICYDNRTTDCTCFRVALCADAVGAVFALAQGHKSQTPVCSCDKELPSWLYCRAVIEEVSSEPDRVEVILDSEADVTILLDA